MHPYQKVLIIIAILGVISIIIRKLHNRSEHKRFIDNAERFAEENEYTKEEHDFFRGEYDYRGRKAKSDNGKMYGDMLETPHKN